MKDKSVKEPKLKELNTCVVDVTISESLGQQSHGDQVSSQMNRPLSPDSALDEQFYNLINAHTQAAKDNHNNQL
jgi:hypothetical protein